MSDGHSPFVGEVSGKRPYETAYVFAHLSQGGDFVTFKPVMKYIFDVSLTGNIFWNHQL